MSSPAVPFTTAGLRPEFFAGARAHAVPRTILVITLSVLVIAGFAFRVHGLSAEGLSEDELNKLNAVTDYRARGLTSSNGEHPFLMKAALSVSVIAAERWNATSFVAAHPEFVVPVEAALRLPNAIVGALAAILIFLIARELFGLEVGLIAAALASFDPLTISFNRIAKEDTFLVFFFLLANVFWIRGQRMAESQPHRRPDPFYWASAAAFGAMLASKYLPQIFAISVAYYYIFQRMPITRWRLGKQKFLKFFLVMGVAFLVCNPAIVLPSTWRTIANFTSYKLMGHDSYEFMGRLYSHRFADWLNGQPWYFYFVLLGVKLPLATLVAFAAGIILLFRRATGDGRYFLLFWLLIWGLTFVIAGGKFTRYATSLMPAVMITAALAIQFGARTVGRFFERWWNSPNAAVYVRAAIASCALISVFWSATAAAPHFRLYMNSVSGGAARAGAYFPQDEFYDAYVFDLMKQIGQQARPGARVASETVAVAKYYAQRAKRSDLVCVDLSNKSELDTLTAGDFLVDARGRTYLSNQAMLARLRAATRPAFTVSVGTTPAADVYLLDQRSLAALRGSD